MTVSARRWYIDPYRVTGATVRKTDAMLAKSDEGRCLECERLADDEDGLCVFCRRKAEGN